MYIYRRRDCIQHEMDRHFCAGRSVRCRTEVTCAEPGTGRAVAEPARAHMLDIVDRMDRLEESVMRDGVDPDDGLDSQAERCNTCNAGSAGSVALGASRLAGWRNGGCAGETAGLNADQCYAIFMPDKRVSRGSRP